MKDLNRAYSLIEEDIKAAAKKMGAISPRYTIPEEIQDKLFDAIRAEDEPENHFNWLDAGCFKQCFSLTRHTIVKFALEDNCTEAERSILNAADQYGIKGFIPTAFISFYGLSLYSGEFGVEADDSTDQEYYDEVEHEWRENPDYVPPEFNYAIIQPRIDETCGGYDYIDYYEDNLGIEGVTKETLNNLNIWCPEWVKAYAQTYGAEELKKLSDFIHKFHIYDLHPDNIGFFYDENDNRIPVIIDWLSE